MAVLAFSLTIKLFRIGVLLSSVMGLQSEETVRVSKTVVNIECALGPSAISEVVSLFLPLALVWNVSSPEPWLPLCPQIQQFRSRGFV